MASHSGDGANSL